MQVKVKLLLLKDQVQVSLEWIQNKEHQLKFTIRLEERVVSILVATEEVLMIFLPQKRLELVVLGQAVDFKGVISQL